eukprot:Lithocolla_globosa_v1_NODE_498_length_3887_cov_84.322025.p2 type:complete len:620 gc:universal NODE_498_length_3887_cov_84.322025:1893-34(-)
MAHTAKKRKTEVTVELLEKYVPKILEAMPADWRGTTFRNSKLLGRAEFGKNVEQLLLEKEKKGETTITTKEVESLGNAEDYLRVATNISTLLELCLAVKKDIELSQVLTFASKKMPVISILLTVDKPVHFYVGIDGHSCFSPKDIELLKLHNCNFTSYAETPKSHENGVVLSLESCANSMTDVVIDDNVAYIMNSAKVNSDEVQVIRKRMSTPVTTPMAETWLQKFCGIPVTTDIKPAKEDSRLTFLTHLQTLCGTEPCQKAAPVVFTAGLPAMCSFYMSLTANGGADILMCSTAYGGSNQLTDLITKQAEMLRKHTFDIQGKFDMNESIENKLSEMSERKDLFSKTILNIEIPTNPDMKVPNIDKICECLKKYQEKTKKDCLLLIDTTFSPQSQVLKKIEKCCKTLPAMCFISLSKSVSRGLTTSGCLVANHTEYARDLLENIRETSIALDTIAKDDQFQVLCKQHEGVEVRLKKAYENAKEAAQHLKKVVKKTTGEEMEVKFVSDEQSAFGFTPATFSFNLPALKNVEAGVNEGLAQHCVDIMTHHSEFKPCVSFGQDNGLVYATVPATSTQGAIKAEDKEKQAVGGVQLCRLSLPPTIDMKKILDILSEAIEKIYK